MTRALGRLTDKRVPQAILKPVLGLYTRAYHVDLAEAIVPTGGYATFNDFFARRLRDGNRPLDADASTVVSPADGRLDDAGPIDPQRTFQVKGQRYDATTLLGSGEDAAVLRDGTCAVVYLSPRDYHRVHAPTDCEVTHVRHIPGTLFPVNDFGVRHVPSLLARNERVVILLRSQTLGTMALVMVGALIVGRISLAFDGPARPPHGGAMAERWYADSSRPRLAKGGEVGAFLLGSTIVLLMQHPVDGDYELVPGTLGSHVRFGQAIARRSRA